MAAHYPKDGEALLKGLVSSLAAFGSLKVTSRRGVICFVRTCYSSYLSAGHTLATLGLPGAWQSCALLLSAD